MSKNDRRWGSYRLPKITSIELSTKNIAFRAIAVGILILIAAISLGNALFSLINQEPGWATVEASSDEINYSTDFTFSYDFSDYGGSATAVNKQLSSLYSDAMENAYRIFSVEVENISAHVNEPVTVDPILYKALELISQYQNRYIYLAPVYVEYNRIFISDNSAEASRYDPAQNPELIPYISQAASYANDPAMIDLELLDNNQVRLNVSDAYLAFAEEYEIDSFLDFAWMRNAFVIDYIADLLIEGGYTSGYLSSYDGFTRNLDERGNAYSYNIFNCLENQIHQPAVLHYSRPTSIVYLRNYAMSDRDRWHYMGFADGSVATIFIDPADGMSKSSVNNLVSYSAEVGCAEILLQLAPVFIADEFENSALTAMVDKDVYSIWCEGTEILYNDPAIQLDITPDASGVTYTAKPEN